uniref:DH domain-containing protein n=1 Tax=Mesocestoides corti TaxID=53468 RepID=A0A5K3FRS2_MESCO
MSTSTEALLEFRQQPLLELVNSEENYVQQLVQVRETYMKVGFPEPPIVGQECLTRSASCKSDRHPKTRPKPPTPPPAELASKWRILWGNWLQLTEWHTQFVEKVRRAVANQPDTVPLLFLRSQARLRSMYMKYCENYPKAVTLVALHKTYFEDLRTYFFDKNDLLSRLMQPIQRATRYQLPMTEALKLTEQAGSADVDVWRDAVAVLKDLPNDVQLMLE